MAVTYIQVDTTKRLGADIRREVDRLRSSLEGLAALNDVILTMVDGADYSLIETVCGVPTGQGETVYNLIAGAKSAVDVSAVTQTINRLG